MLSPTRRQKNVVLAIANMILVPIIWAKLLSFPDALGLGMKIWAIAAPAVALIVLLDRGPRQIVKSMHLGLFLCTGAAIGLTGGAILRSLESVWTAELIWLPLGIAAAVYHYWPSSSDEYQ